MRVSEAAAVAAIYLTVLYCFSSAEVEVSQDNTLEDGQASRQSSEEQATREEKIERIARRVSKSSQNKLPEFSAPIGNITAVAGRDVRLVCTVEHLGQYQVAWLKEETKTILSIDTNIITTNYRIFLIPDEEERKWVLHIKDVRGSDRGFYQCQVNTIPVRSASGYLEVVEPPTLIESQTSQVVESIEYSNVSIQCKADAHPRATITWRRDDGSPIKLSGRQLNRTSEYSLALPGRDTQTVGSSSLLNDIRSDKLSLFEVDRSMAGIYVCTATNGIPTPVSKRIPLYVKFAPKTSVLNKYVSVSLGEQLEIDCLIEAFPKANSYWSRKSILRKQATNSRAASWSNQAASALRLNSASWLRQKQSNDSMIEPSQANQPTSSGTDKTMAPRIVLDQFLNNQQHHFKPTIDQQHPHNRIQLRQTIHSLDHDQTNGNKNNTSVDEEDDLFSLPRTSRQHRRLTRFNELMAKSSEINFAINPANSQPDQMPEASSTRASVSVKQSAINSFTYKLKLTIAKVQQEDYGEYSCIASNSMGNSESMITVTRADKISDGLDSLSSLNQDNFVASTEPYFHQQPSQAATRRTAPHTVYDENYLQAIKSRQNNLGLGSNSRLEQRLRLRQHSNHGLSYRRSKSRLIMLVAPLLTAVIYGYGFGDTFLWLS